MIAKTPSTNWFAELHRALVDSFNIEALDLICLGLGIHLETLKGHNLPHKAVSLIEHMQQYGRLNELVDACQRLCPSHSWERFRQLIPRAALDIHPDMLQTKNQQGVTGQLSHKPYFPLWAVILLSFLSLMMLAVVR